MVTFYIINNHEKVSQR